MSGVWRMGSEWSGEWMEWRVKSEEWGAESGEWSV